MSATVTGHSPDRSIAVIDIDGVVADVRHRVRFLDQRPRNWDRFFGAAHEDPPLAAGLERVRDLARDHEILWLTGRPERLRSVTADWLTRHELPDGRLIMRGDADRRPAKIYKRGELRRLRDQLPGLTVAVVLDDDADVITTLSADGWPTEHAKWVHYLPELGRAQEGSGRT